jgi:D-glycero-alpha-D-manno-heptose-7-phosphate kinase
MIISRTPYRVSFFGGGTDYPAWYRDHGGAVLAATIDKYCYLTVRYLPPFFEHRIRMVYSIIESCQTLDEIAHPAVREALRFLNVNRGIEIHHDGDLPARSGMGTSSSFTVGLLHALHALIGQMASKRQLAEEAIHLEQGVLKETVGCQDQIMAAHGGLNHIVFETTGGFSTRPVIASPERKAELARHLMLYYTGIKRTAAHVAASYVPRIADRRRQMQAMLDLVDQGLSVVSGTGDLTEFGKLLHEAWVVKSALGPHVSNRTIDQIYEEALAAGAVGGKLLGAGGGGFLLLFVRPDDQPAVRERLDSLVYVPFEFENSGSQIIFYEADKDYSSEEEARNHGKIRAFRELSEIAPM